ncbi:uncharacterized protein LOC133139928 isoform X2 [Conger conger]|uniref:uncharacterized protein LOC133139928 isoform X2 n=1 Tax=Conger conger TaxID=82655 RepID=UPI002A5A71A4|nr:uncharacterized protein LOC133139928 isoform X2 [Conger conger]
MRFSLCDHAPPRPGSGEVHGGRQRQAETAGSPVQRGRRQAPEGCSWSPRHAHRRPEEALHQDHPGEQEVQGEKSEAVGYPVPEIGGEGPRPWSGPSHSCPEPEAEAEEEEGEAEEGEAEETEGEAEEGEAEETEAEAEETEAEDVQSGVQEALENSQSEPGSQPSPLEGMEVLQTEVMLPATPTDGTAGQSSRKRRNEKPGDPANTQRTPPPFHLQGFSFKIATRYYITILILFQSNPIHARTTSTSAHPHTRGYIGSGGKCVLCRDPQCAAHRLKICIGDNCTWLNRTLGIKHCSKDNLKLDEPCQLTDRSLVVQSDKPITFEGNDSLSGDMKAIPSEIVSPLVNTAANTMTPDTRNSGVDIRVVIGVLIVIIIVVAAGIIVWKYGKRRDRMSPQNTAPPDGNARNENEMSPLQSDANGNVTQGPGNDGTRFRSFLYPL